MPSLLAAFLASLIPGLVGIALLLAIGEPWEWRHLSPGLFLFSGWYAAPFLIMRLHRERARGRPVAVVVGLFATLAAFGLVTLDAVIVEPGWGASIGADLLLLVLPVPLYVMMLALSFVNWSAIGGPRVT